jgi:hypothetical protein
MFRSFSVAGLKRAAAQTPAIKAATMRIRARTGSSYITVKVESTAGKA